MRCPFCRTPLTPEARGCGHCGKNVPDKRAADAAFGVGEIRGLLLHARDRLDGDVRALQARLEGDFRRIEEKLEILASGLRAAPLPDSEVIPEVVAEAFAEESSSLAAASPPTEPPVADPVATTANAPEPPDGEDAPPAGTPPRLDQPSVPWTPPPRLSYRPETAFDRPPSPAGSNFGQGLAELHFGQKWLLIAGVVVMVLGLGYFLKYSFDRDWIGPAGRVTLAYLAGMVCLGAGERFRRAAMYRGFGFALMGGGVAILYFSGFAAFQIYGLVSQPVAFGMLVLVTASAGMLAYVHNAQWMAQLGLIGGFATPILLSTGTANQVALMTYMAVLNLAVLALARLRAWPALTTLAFLFTWFIFSGWFVFHYREDRFWITTIYLNLFYLVHFLAPVAYYLRRASPVATSGFTTSLPNAFIAFGFSHYTITRYAGSEYVAVVTLAYALMAVALASWLRRRAVADRRLLAMLLVQGVLFLIITVPVLFSRHWITVFWAAQAVALLWAARRLDDPAGGARWNDGARLAGGAVVLLALALGKLYFYDYALVFGLGSGVVYHPAFADGVLERWLTIGSALAALPFAARWAPGLWRRDHYFLVGLFAVLLFVSLNLETAAFFGEKLPAARFAALSVLWGVYAATLLILGFARNSSLLRKSGIGLFGFAIGKVFLVDMANATTPFRIVSFLAVGVLLIGASFLYYYYRDRLLPTRKESPPPADGKGDQP